jgi:hypothetical protein
MDALGIVLQRGVLVLSKNPIVAATARLLLAEG